MRTWITFLLLTSASSLFANLQLKEAVKEYQITRIKLEYGTQKQDLVDSLSNLSYTINKLPDSEIKKIEAKVGLGFFDALNDRMVFQQLFWRYADSRVSFMTLRPQDRTADFSRELPHTLIGSGAAGMDSKYSALHPRMFCLKAKNQNKEIINQAAIRDAISIYIQLIEKDAYLAVSLDDLEVGSGLGSSLNYAVPLYNFEISSHSHLFLAINDEVELLAKNLN